jgi:hypothetical protein
MLPEGPDQDAVRTRGADMIPTSRETILSATGMRLHLVAMTGDGKPSVLEALRRQVEAIVAHYGYERLLIGLAAGIAVQIVLLAAFRLLFKLLGLSVRVLTFAVAVFVALYVLNYGSPTLVDQKHVTHWSDQGVELVRTLLDEHHG